MARSIRVVRELSAPVDIVWRALTEKELLAEWLMPNDFEPIVGRHFHLRTDSAPGFDGIVDAELLEYDPPRRMLWRWTGGPIDTTVEFQVEALGPVHTRVSVEQRGFVGLGAWVVSAVLQLGWRKLLGKELPRLLDFAADD